MVSTYSEELIEILLFSLERYIDKHKLDINAPGLNIENVSMFINVFNLVGISFLNLSEEGRILATRIGPLETHIVYQEKYNDEFVDKESGLIVEILS